jgi:polyhydroxyalkanoate synthesis regulator phasin
MKRRIALLCFLLVVLAAGCAAPPNIQAAQKVQRQAIINYAANANRLLRTWSSIYQKERVSDIEYTTAKATAILDEHAKDGKVTVEEAKAAIAAVIAKRDQAMAQTHMVQDRMAQLTAVNAKELSHVLSITDSLNTWMNTGPSIEMVDKLTDALLEALTKPRTTAAGGQ